MAKKAKKSVSKKATKKATTKKVAKKPTAKKTTKKKAVKKTSSKKSVKAKGQFTDSDFYKAYQKHKGNVVKMAEELHVARTSVYKRCSKLDKEPKKLEDEWADPKNLIRLYRKTNANYSEMARLSGLARQTVMRRCKALKLKPRINSLGKINKIRI